MKTVTIVEKREKVFNLGKILIIVGGWRGRMTRGSWSGERGRGWMFSIIFPTILYLESSHQLNMITPKDLYRDEISDSNT